MPKKILAIFGNVALYGQERANIKVFDALQKEGAEVQLLVNDRGFHWHLQPEVEAHKLKYKKIRFPWNFRKTPNLRIWWIHLRDIVLYNIQFVKAYRQLKPDYLHMANDFFFMMLVPSLIFIKCPIIFRLGDVPTTRYFFEKSLWKHFILKRIHHLVCISQFIANEVLKIQPHFNKYSIIYNVPPKRIHAAHPEVSLKADNNLFTVAYVGQIEKLKGVHLILEAARQLIPVNENIRFIFAGDIEHSKLFKEINANEFYAINKDKLLFLGKVQHIDAIYAASNIHLAPSIVNEALSNVVGEAKKNSRPSIVFNSGGLPELVSHKKDGYICSGKTAEDIVEAIEYYYHAPQKAREHGLKAYSSLKTLNLTDEYFNQQWARIYQLD